MVKLLRHLSSLGICTSGTIRDGRTEKCPLRPISEMKREQRGSHDYRFSNNGNILLVRWKDNNVVTIATNYDGIENGTCRRYVRGQGAVQIPQPKVFQHYNQGMGGVDKMDQLVAVYRTRIRQRKWWWPIFVYLLDVSVVNAWLLMKKVDANNKACASLLIFRRYLAETYLERYGVPSARRVSRLHINDDLRFDNINHIVEYSETDQRCANCGKKSNFVCPKCDKGLHPKYCFKIYHTSSVPNA